MHICFHVIENNTLCTFILHNCSCLFVDMWFMQLNWLCCSVYAVVFPGAIRTNLLSMRPIGVVSKKLIADRKMLSNILAWSSWDARTMLMAVMMAYTSTNTAVKNKHRQLLKWLNKMYNQILEELFSRDEVFPF